MPLRPSHLIRIVVGKKCAETAATGEKTNCGINFYVNTKVVPHFILKCVSPLNCIKTEHGRLPYKFRIKLKIAQKKTVLTRHISLVFLNHTILWFDISKKKIRYSINNGDYCIQLNDESLHTCERAYKQAIGTQSPGGLSIACLNFL